MRLFSALLVCCRLFAETPGFTLSADVVPLKHMVDLTIDPAKPTFDGQIRIQVELKKPAAELWINAKDITPLEASVGAKRAKTELAGGEFLKLQLDSPIAAGPATISIRYQGKLDENSVVGPYRKKVGDDWYVFTTFTPADARRAFPCFDEPRFKTPWEMTIHVPAGNKAFANGRELRETEEPDGLRTIHFAETRPLPAEVVAFAAGPFDVFQGSKAGHGTPIRIITPRGLGEQGKAAAQATVDVLPRLEAYTGIPYPFGKLDHLALPEGAFGAVENPGLITYRQRGLLAAPGEDTPAKTHSIRSVESHEIAHQWFGDMVTQAAWDDVWLSEGFATWLSAKILDEEQPPERRHLAAVAARDRIMTTDDSPRTRPVRLEMQSRDDLKNVYSQIVYQKGAAILLMLEGWLGEDPVRSGLRAYLKKHAFANATTADLESELSRAARTGPAPVMDSFLNQTGIPVLRGSIQCGALPHIEIEQINSAHQWTIPFCWRSDSGSSCAVIDAPRRDVALKSCPSWIYLNAGATGYYRTAWTAEQIEMLTRALANLSAAERLMLIYDLRALPVRIDASPLLSKLAADAEPEIAKAAAEAK